jgi:hypothetical protein
MVKRESIFQNFTDLTDWEIISAFTYCKKTKERKTPMFEKEFFTLCVFFFEGDLDSAEQSLDEIMIYYRKEFSKRNSN